MPTVDLSVYQELAATNTWIALYPELALALLALLVLTLDLFLPARLRGLLPTWSILGQVLLLGVMLADFAGGGILAGLQGSTRFGGLVEHSALGDFFRVFFLVASIAATYLAKVSLAKQTVPRTEYHPILLVMTSSLMLLAQSNHFVLLFVSLETVTVCLYVLVSYFRGNALTLEAGFKYLVMGGLSSALLLFGIVLLYGIAGSAALNGAVAEPMNFDQLAEFIRLNPQNPLVLAGVVLVLAGVFFKIGAFPFQMWVPDVYQGAPTPTTALLAVSSKAAGFAVLLLLVMGPFASLGTLLTQALAAVAAGSILFGNFAALTQRNVKRLIGLSGVSHAGFLLMGVAALHAGSVSLKPMILVSIAVYLVGYLFASTAVFAVMAHVGGADDSQQELEQYDELSRREPFLAGLLAVGVGSLAGIPPTVGFIGKALLFLAAYKAGLGWLLAVALVGVVVSIYYYFGWIKAAFFDTWRLPPVQGEAPAKPEPAPLGISSRIFLGAVALGILILGVAPWPLTRALLP